MSSHLIPQQLEQREVYPDRIWITLSEQVESDPVQNTGNCKRLSGSGLTVRQHCTYATCGRLIVLELNIFY